MIDSASIRVVPFSKEEYVPADHSDPPLFTWQEYYSFRNNLVRIMQPYGTVGPMGEMPILEEWETSEEAWQAGTSNPDFFVPSDLWNYHDRWNRVEASPWLVNTKLLYDLIAMVRKWKGWCVYLALVQGGLTILADRVLHEGDLFAGASSVEELGQRCVGANK
ncbi:MAG: hypothetical protein JWO19_2583 [Bryobacterales bacterium]|nr:hypothetical protein [Bryobacterales bacterium]